MTGYCYESIACAPLHVAHRPIVRFQHRMGCRETVQQTRVAEVERNEFVVWKERE